MPELDKVAVEQEDYRDLLRIKPAAGGPTLEEESIQGSVSKYGEDTIVNMSVAVGQVYWNAKSEVLRISVAILDHLDTLGMEVRFKR